MGEVSYKGHRYPAEIIAHCGWLYHRFPLSFREVEELMLVRGVTHVRDDPAVVRQVRTRLRGRPAPPPTPTRRQVAPRRGVLDDHRPSSLPVAGRRPGRQRPGHPDLTSPGCQRRQAVLLLSC